MWTQEPWGRALRCRYLPAEHLFTAGDVELRDDREEWAAVAASSGVDPGRLLLITQVHGARVAVARRGDARSWARPRADVIVTDDPDVAIAVRVADCAPVLIADSRRGVVAAAHAGWRGTVKRVAAVAVRALFETFGSDPADLVAAIGPCLGPCCGEVGGEVVGAFRAAGHDEASVRRWLQPGPSGRAYLDLWRANRDQLEAAGVPATKIHVAELCTKTHADVLHSYRAKGNAAGRMAALIKCREPADR